MASDTLRRVGWLLVAVGAADVGVMVYCIVNEMNYRSSLNIFAVVAGLLLVRQSLKTARAVAWFAAFLLTALIGAAVLFPILTPLDLWGVQLRLRPVATLSTVVIAAAVVCLVFWVYRSLTSEVVLEACRSAGMKATKPILPFIVGAVLVVGLFAMMIGMTRGASAEMAKQKAREKLGPNYKYHVTAMQWSGSGGSATLTAYNATEIKEVKVRW
jgi:lysylphosphatidylglycerol synthetase-like protein (DUF2156 family)